jgi:hypothetical protein
MKVLKDLNISFLLVESDRSLLSYLYSREYQLLELKSYQDGVFNDCVIAFTDISNSELRKDSLHIIKHFERQNILVKYKDSHLTSKVYNTGDEKPHSILEYNTNPNLKSYIHNGVSFSFKEEDQYYFPKDKSEFKTGLLVECFTTNGWIERKVDQVDIEYDKTYKLLVKYQKVRIKHD